MSTHQYGALYSHASERVYPDLVDGPLDKATLQKRIAAANRNNTPGVRVEREVVDGKPGPWTLPNGSTDLVAWLQSWSAPPMNGDGYNVTQWGTR